MKCIVYFLSCFHLNSTHSLYDSLESVYICAHSSFHYFHPHPGIQSKGREYVQPQWVFDSINAQTLLPVSHLTPCPHQPCSSLLYSSKIPSMTALECYTTPSCSIFYCGCFPLCEGPPHLLLLILYSLLSMLSGREIPSRCPAAPSLVTLRG